MNRNFKKFLLLWSGELISSIGSGLTSFGLGVYIFNQTGSAASMAIITLLGFLPSLSLSVIAGALADRYDRRLLMILGDGLSALGILYILISMLFGSLNIVKIGIGITISSIFSSLLEPSYKATITDLLDKEDYSKASGLVNLAGSSKYLISPVLAGLLLSITRIETLLIIDVCTIFITVLSTLVVRKCIDVKKLEPTEGFFESIKKGIIVIKDKEGILPLIIVASVLTLFIGVFQVLAEPLILSFSNSKILGICESMCASGMLVSSILLGFKGIKGKYVKILIMSLIISGVSMSLFGVWENIYLLTIFGFVFFLMLPYANTCLDYLVRTNIDENMQGRAWGLIGNLSQIGYVFAYALSGVFADLIGTTFGIGVGRGAGVVIMVSGILLVMTSLSMIKIKSIKKLEN